MLVCFTLKCLNFHYHFLELFDNVEAIQLVMKINIWLPFVIGTIKKARKHEIMFRKPVNYIILYKYNINIHFIYCHLFIRRYIINNSGSTFIKEANACSPRGISQRDKINFTNIHFVKWAIQRQKSRYQNNCLHVNVWIQVIMGLLPSCKFEFLQWDEQGTIIGLVQWTWAQLCKARFYYSV